MRRKAREALRSALEAAGLPTRPWKAAMRQARLKASGKVEKTEVEAISPAEPLAKRQLKKKRKRPASDLQARKPTAPSSEMVQKKGQVQQQQLPTENQKDNKLKQLLQQQTQQQQQQCPEQPKRKKKLKKRPQSAEVIETIKEESASKPVKKRVLTKKKKPTAPISTTEKSAEAERKALTPQSQSSTISKAPSPAIPQVKRNVAGSALAWLRG
eukprot:TRINITY_DN6676_c1_g1_i1.p1 TRINITY_DN6676_c1_g1~~TRINITY_DN6676_c1_g1_i1.p1  ORF type:complete len:213 (+),score=71.24 TRINITY_DN6676_c1_g1_i1:124-762(+)